MFRRFISKVLFPTGKLSDTFPWTVQTAGKKYFVALWHFAVGSFLVPLAFMGVMFGVAQFPVLRESLSDSTLKVLVEAALASALAACVLNFLRHSLKGSSAILSKTLRGAPYYLLFGIAVAALLPTAVRLFAPHFETVLNTLFNFMAQPDGTPKMSFVMGLSLISFVAGFGMQVRYIAGEMQKEGLSLAKAMALTLEPLKGSWWGATLFNLVLPVAIAYGLTQLIGYAVVSVMGAAHQPTVDLARQATGGNFLLFALMAVLGAPIFEELVFRGFLFQVLRCSLKREQQALVLKAVPESGLGRLFIIADNWLRTRSYKMTSCIHKLFGGKRAELSAVILSSLIFSLMHMQFQPTTVVLLFLLGCVQAEIYRRTGSLYTGMLLHAVNNGIDVLKLALGQA